MSNISLWWLLIPVSLSVILLATQIYQYIKVKSWAKQQRALMKEVSDV